MGGHAFAHLSPPLPTPRMPPEIYAQVLSTTHTLLKQHYRLVGSPIEAPGKDTFGDVDILVFEPKSNSPLNGLTPRSQLANQLASSLGAKHHILEKGNPTMNFAVPWPRQNVDEEEMMEEKYIQLDVKICESEKMFEWELFHAAHGDLWNILGSTIRKFGLTVNNLGMYIRIPEIELFDRKKSMIFMTDDHGQILELLGLDPQRWWKNFDSREEMFEYAAGCRMFWIKDLDEEAEDADDGRPEIDTGVMEGQEGGELGKKKLKHNDRARMAKRPIFREWMDEFIPRCRSEGRFADSKGVTREQIRDESFTQFGSAIKTTYETRVSEWALARHTDDLWRVIIKGSVPEDVDPQFRAASIRTLKGTIIGGETFDGKAVPEVAQNQEVSNFEFLKSSEGFLTADFLQGFWDSEKVRAWVIDNWKKAGEIGCAKQQERATEGMKAKAEKKGLRAEGKAAKRIQS
jgi:hypothetical protein